MPVGEFSVVELPVGALVGLEGKVGDVGKIPVGPAVPVGKPPVGKMPVGMGICQVGKPLNLLPLSIGG